MIHVGLLFAFIQAQASSELIFKPLQEVEEKDAEKGGKGLLIRLKAHGYQDMACRIIHLDGKAHIAVSCGSGITAEMRETIRKLARWPLKSFEFKSTYRMSQAESEQYQAPKAPKGGVWIPTADFRYDMTPKPDMLLVKDRPPIATFKDLPQPKQDGMKQWYFEVSSSLANKLGDKDGWYAVIDGYIVNCKWTVGTVEIPNKKGPATQVQAIFPPFDQLVWVMINNPLPFGMELKD